MSQDIVMKGSAMQTDDWFGVQSPTSPATLPAGGDWIATISGYGTADYFRFSGQANRTLSVEVTALNEAGIASQSKALPVIGMWTMPNTASPAEAFTPIPFNTSTFGLTRLDQVTLLTSTDFRIGIADYRGDGRPDFQYHARIFYGDRVVPARASAGGGTAISIAGLGFRPNTAITIASASAPLLGISANQMQTSAPASRDGVQDLLLTDPATGASSLMTGVLTIGAGPNDGITMLPSSNQPSPVGADAPNPVRVRVIAPDGVTSVAGASVFFQTVPDASLSACGGGANCTVLTDQSGQAATRVALRTGAPVTITAQLAPASYSPARQVVTTLPSNAGPPLDIALAVENIRVAQGAALDLPVKVRVLAAGVPQSNRPIDFMIMPGNTPLSSAPIPTDAAGNAATTLHLSAVARQVQAIACVAPDEKPCSRVLTIIPVAPSFLRLQAVAGDMQAIAIGQAFQQVVVRVTDSDDPQFAHPVAGASVLFQATITRPQDDSPSVMIGDTNIHRNPAPVVLGSYQLAAVSDEDGLATIVLPAPEMSDVEILGTASTGSATLSLRLRVLAPLPVPITPARAVAQHLPAPASSPIRGVLHPAPKRTVTPQEKTGYRYRVD